MESYNSCEYKLLYDTSFEQKKLQKRSYLMIGQVAIDGWGKIADTAFWGEGPLITALTKVTTLIRLGSSRSILSPTRMDQRAFTMEIFIVPVRLIGSLHLFDRNWQSLATSSWKRLSMLVLPNPKSLKFRSKNRRSSLQ